MQYVYGFALVRLGDIANIKTGQKPNNIVEEGLFEYINAGTTKSGFVESYNCEGDIVTTPSRGQGGIGFIGYQKNRFWLGPLCYGIKSKNSRRVLNKFLYYILNANSSQIMSIKKSGGVPAINSGDLAMLVIPLPPINEQERIVEILDRFDKLCNDLSEGLPAEIDARQKQYEYYRDKLLRFKEEGLK